MATLVNDNMTLTAEADIDGSPTRIHRRRQTFTGAYIKMLVNEPTNYTLIYVLLRSCLIM